MNLFHHLLVFFRFDNHRPRLPSLSLRECVWLRRDQPLRLQNYASPTAFPAFPSLFPKANPCNAAQAENIPPFAPSRRRLASGNEKSRCAPHRSTSRKMAPTARSAQAATR
jgi:hypothetical protein